tara:strand:- start:7909 stop:8226 length:318 start_codon:yes stop_codon:yes gene_type:complete
MNKKEGIELIEDLLKQKSKRLEIIQILEERGVPTSSAYRWHMEAYKNDKWEDPLIKKDSQILLDKNLAIDCLRDQLNKALVEDNTEKIVSLSSELLKAHKTARSF